jgi:hypothetical protein
MSNETTTKQGEKSKDVTKVTKLNVPTSWPTVRSIEELDAAGKWAARARLAAGLSKALSVNIGSTSSTYRSQGSTGSGAGDPTLRDIVIDGKQITWQVFPLRAELENFLPYFVVVDLWQNYVKRGASIGMVLDVAIMVSADADMWYSVLTKIGGVSEAEFTAFVTVAQSLVAFYGVQGVGDSIYNPNVSDGSTKAATPKADKRVTDISTLFG